jgi:hypothetical protein
VHVLRNVYNVVRLSLRVALHNRWLCEFVYCTYCYYIINDHLEVTQNQDILSVVLWRSRFLFCNTSVQIPSSSNDVCGCLLTQSLGLQNDVPIVYSTREYVTTLPTFILFSWHKQCIYYSDRCKTGLLRTTLNLLVNKNVYTHTHTHIYIYIYII